MIHSGIKIGMKKIFYSFDEEISRNTWEILEPIVLWKTERIVVMKRTLFNAYILQTFQQGLHFDYHYFQVSVDQCNHHKLCHARRENSV